MNVTTETATVLVVDDESDLADLYAALLETDHEVETAYDGERALDLIDDSVDVVFLDRQMPDMSGDEVLEVIDERGLGCRVVLVTAVNPDFDIIDMPVDDYLTKPVDGSELHATVDAMLARESYDKQFQEYFSMVSKKTVLESEKPESELNAHEEYREVSQRVEELQKEADQAADEIDDFESVFRDFPSG
jgi:DNA-binding response OmpR family regulator